MGNVKVSVIVPVYNTENYLKRSIDSLLKQSLKELEILIVDDGSTDNSGKILDEYALKYPEKIKVFHKENGGQATARNLALKHCSGEYIGFLDSDDSQKPDMYEKMYRKAKEIDADYVCCGYEEVCYQDNKKIILNDYVASKYARKTEDLFFGALVPPYIHLYKKEILIDHRIDFPEGYIYEDTAFYINAIPYIKKIGVLEEAFTVRVKHANSTMTITKKERVANIFPVVQFSIDFYKERGLYSKYCLPLEYFYVRILLCSSMQRIARVKGYREAWDLVEETLNFINSHFPNYRKNPYFKKGLSNLYMRTYNSVTAHIYFPLFRLMSKMERRYE